MSATTMMTFDLNQTTMARIQDSFGEFGVELIRLLSDKYGFDVADAIESVGLQALKISTKKGGRKASGEKKAPAPKKAKPSVPLPFVGNVNDDDCFGIRVNHQLHTQCQNDRMDGGEYCKTCQKQADGNASGKPNCGDIRDRLDCPLLEFRDPKGRQTLPYGNVIAKLGLDKQVCLDEAAKFGVDIPEEQFEIRETRRGRPKKAVTEVSDTDSDAPKRKRGRPRKQKQVEAVVTDDLLSALAAAERNAEAVDDGNVSDSGSSIKSGKTNVSKRGRKPLSEEEKAERLAKKAALKKAREEERAAKKAQKEAEKAAAKAAKEAEKAELKKMREAEKEQKKAEKEAAKAAAKAAKEAEKAAAKEAAPKSPTPVVEEEAAPAEVARQCPESVSPEEEEQGTQVKKFEFEGVTYMRDEDNILYDMKTQEVVGLWDEETQTIDKDVEFASDDEDEDDE